VGAHSEVSIVAGDAAGVVDTVEVGISPVLLGQPGVPVLAPLPARAGRFADCGGERNRASREHHIHEPRTVSHELFDVFADDSYTSNAPDVRASLRIRGDTLDPDFVTQHLGVAPTFSARRGEALEDDGGEAETGVWTYRLDAPSGTELGEVLEMLLGRFPNDSTLWQELADAYTIDVSCALHLRADIQHTVVDSAVLERLARLGLSLGLDLHAP
jgi:hypothetical protein